MDGQKSPQKSQDIWKLVMYYAYMPQNILLLSIKIAAEGGEILYLAQKLSKMCLSGFFFKFNKREGGADKFPKI